MTNPSATAILIFSRTAREEGRSGRYGSSHRAGAGIARQLIRHTVQAARHTGLRVIRIPSSRQRGSDFGERFANAIDDVFALGYERVIALGTDTPGITVAAIQSLAENCAHDEIVAGPAPDGGVWGIGIPRKCWRPALFIGIGWQTAAVQSDLSCYALAVSASYRTVVSLTDVDEPAGLAAWVRGSAQHQPLARAIASMLSRPDVFGTACGPVLDARPAYRPLRGPPAAF